MSRAVENWEVTTLMSQAMLPLMSDQGRLTEGDRRPSTIDLLVKLACFVKKNKIFSV
jgi:hypothetical protein